MTEVVNVSSKTGTRVLLSTLWVVVMINMLAADILSLYIPGSLEELAKFAGDTPISQFMLIGAIVMEIAILMIILSRVLKYAVNRWVNIVAGVLMLGYIWGGASSYPHYFFIGAVETVCLLLIIWNAWKWSGAGE